MLKCAEPIMTEEKAWAWVVDIIKQEGLLVNGEIPKHLIMAAKSHAKMLSRKCPYKYEEE